MAQSKLNVIVEGNIAAGKTSFLTYLSKKNTIDINYEPVDEKWTNINGVNLLAKFYEDPKKYAFEFQMYVMLTLAAQEKKARYHQIRCRERSIFSSLKIFTQALLDYGYVENYQAKILKEQYDFCIAAIDDIIPDVIIYFQVEPKRCVLRAESRNREGEKVNTEYLDKLNLLYHTWISTNSKKVKDINGNISLFSMQICNRWVKLYYVAEFNISQQEEIFSQLNQLINNELNECNSDDNSVFQVELLSRYAHPPKKATDGSVGYDLFTPIHSKIEPRATLLLPLDIKIKIPTGCYGRIAPRSGLALKGIDIGGGVIDRDYQGNICVILYNHSDNLYTISPGDRIAQLIFEVAKSPAMILKKINYDESSTRKAAGFGSTGN